MRTSNVFGGLVCVVLTACGGGGGGGDNTPPPAAFAIGGTVSGLTGTLVVQNDGADNITLSTNGPFRFGSTLASGGTYQVSVLTQPANQQCSVSSGAGVVATANVSNITITCTNTGSNTPKFKVGGTVTGLSGSLVLENNSGQDTLSILQNGPFTFGALLVTGAEYQVAVRTQPANQQCSVSASSGKVAAADIANIDITCTSVPPPTFAVGGNVYGLAGTLALRNNGSDVLVVTANGPFTFPNRLLSGTPYFVDIQTAPPNQQCTVSSGSGTMAAADVVGVVVTCRSRYTLGGSVSGLSGTLVLQNNGGDNLAISGNGSFMFATRPFSGDAYQVTLLTQPASQYCRVMKGAGAVPAGNVNDIKVACNTLRSSRYLYVVSDGPDYPRQISSSLSQYSIGHDGTVTPLSPATVSTGAQASSVAVDPSGSFVYVTDNGVNNGNGTVWQYTIGATGALAPMSVGSVPAGVNAARITIHPTGRFAYVVNMGVASTSGSIPGSISQYSISPDGSLVPLSPAEIAMTEVNPSSIGIDPTGRFAYVTGFIGLSAGRVLQYRIGADGTLTPLGPNAIDPGVILIRSLTADPFGRAVYFPENMFGYIFQYAIQGDGSLAPFNPPSLYNSTISPNSFAIDPTGTYAYSGAPGSISLFNIADDGRLTLSPNRATVDWVSPIVVDWAGKYLYAGARNPVNSVLQYAIGSDGALVSLTPTSVPTAPNPVSLAISP